MVEGRVIGCGCSIASGFFLNGASCVNCSTISTVNSGITTAQCQACNSTNFARTTI